MREKKVYKTYKKGQVVYADLGKKPPGVEGGLRPCVVVSRDASNHSRSPQITVCPLSSKLKDILVHVRIKPEDVDGYHLQTVSDFMPEDMQTIPKSAVRGTIGYIGMESEVMKVIDMVLITQLGLLQAANELVKGEVE